ncbi:hypothetical protein IV203_031398 [Nitzschia inconspicua]|uniref:Uncharacterized protein n=1 Tax=Nitzschia inconspicua TaxID=303405 RepID=A0A9K3LVM7_9STRA|nr:hypothetical protein IV203_031398 [Nitzschia inconspicua]
MLTLSSQQLALVKKVKFRFCDPQLGEKYNVETLASSLFEIAEPKGSVKVNADSLSIVSIPQDVMYRMRKTLLSAMSSSCMDPIERVYLSKWCDSFIFMSSRGKAIRHSSHVREAIVEAAHAKEASVSIIIDSSACVKIPKRFAPIAAASTNALTARSSILSTPLRRSHSNEVAADVTSTIGRPPLAPKSGNSPIKQSATKKSPFKLSPCIKKTLPLSLTLVSNEEVPSSKMKILSVSNIAIDEDKEDEEMIDVEPIPLNALHNDKNVHSFSMEDLLEDCVNGDALMLAYPDAEDISPFLVSAHDDDGLLPFNVSFHSMIECGPTSPERKDDNTTNNTHCFLLPSFFDESTSLTASHCDNCLGDSSLFNAQERDMLQLLQSVVDIVDSTILDASAA